MIREYRPGDCDELLGVWARASALAHPFLDREFLERERRNIPDLYLSRAQTWVWESGGRVVGFLALLGNEIGAVFVAPSHHRTGIGRALVERAQTLRGTLEVEVFARNRIGRGFYAGLGFEPVRQGIHRETGFELLRLRLEPGRAPEPAADRGGPDGG